jgi:phage baseplate assembly protein gpV
VSTLYDTIRKIVQQELARVRTAELAVVQQVHPADPDNYSCTVVLRDSDMVLKQVPLTTPRKGVAMVPDVGDLVLVQFIGGQINAPVITGTLYNDEDRPPLNAEKQAVIHLPADADEASALRIELNTDPANAVVLSIGGALKLTLIDDDPVVKLDVADGSATLTIARDGTVKLESGNALNIKASADINIEAGGQMNLKGSTINLN